MSDSVFETVEKSSQILKLDFSSTEFARLAEEQELTEAQIEAIGTVLEYLQRKKIDTTIHTLLKMSRLPLKDPKTFDNFDFSVIKGRDAAKLKTLPSLSAIYAHRNLAFIGPAGTGKTHLAQAFGYECCQRGIKTYFIKMSELREKFTTARRAGKEASILNGLVRPSCLIIDEVGHCEFDKENAEGYIDVNNVKLLWINWQNSGIALCYLHFTAVLNDSGETAQSRRNGCAISRGILTENPCLYHPLLRDFGQKMLQIFVNLQLVCLACFY